MADENQKLEEARARFSSMRRELSRFEESWSTGITKPESVDLFIRELGELADRMRRM